MRSTAQEIPDPESIAESKAEKLGTVLARAAGASDQSVQQFGGELVGALATTLHQYPSRVEAVESLLLGRKVARATRTMITGDEPSPPRASSSPSIVSVRATPNPAALQETVRFSVKGQHVTQYRWAFGNGTTASGRSVTHTFRRPGHHEVTVTALSSGGRDTRSVSVNVEATPYRRLYGALRTVITGLSSPWSESRTKQKEFQALLETTEQKSTRSLLSGVRDEIPGTVSDIKALLETSSRVLQKIEAQHQPYLLTQYSTALQRIPVYQTHRANLDVPESADGGFALYAAVARPLDRYAQGGGATSEVVAAYRQANHVCPVLRYAIRSSQSVAGSLEASLDQNLRWWAGCVLILSAVGWG